MRRVVGVHGGATGWHRAGNDAIEREALFGINDRGTTWNEYYVGVTGIGVARLRRWGLIPTDGLVRSLHGDLKPVESAFRALQRLVSARADSDEVILATVRVLLAIGRARVQVKAVGAGVRIDDPYVFSKVFKRASTRRLVKA